MQCRWMWVCMHYTAFGFPFSYLEESRHKYLSEVGWGIQGVPRSSFFPLVFSVNRLPEILSLSGYLLMLLMAEHQIYQSSTLLSNWDVTLDLNWKISN